MKKYNYIFTLKKRSNNTNVADVARRISELLPSAIWIENTPIFLVKRLDIEAYFTAAKLVGGERCFLDFGYDYECVKGSPEWLRQQIRQRFFPDLPAQERTQVLLFLSGLPIAGYVLISFTASQGTSQHLSATQFLITAIFFLVTFLSTWFYYWVFDEDEKSKLTLGLRALPLALLYILFASIVKQMLLS